MMFDEGDYYYSATDVFSSCLGSLNSNSNKKKMMNKRRFSDEQVRSLESIFENETKLEPKKKVEVAKQLGLQPRQVAIWFQNKRARYKSKQLEHDYALLRANYDSLASQFETLKKEKHSLFLQLQKLKEVSTGKGEEESQNGNNASVGAANSSHHESKSEETKKSSEEWEEKPALSMEGSDYGASCILSSDEGSSENINTNDNDNNNNNDSNNEKMNYLGVVEEEEEEMMRMNMMEGSNNTAVGVGSSLSEEACWDDCYSDPEALFDQQQAVDSCGHWWDFWS